MTTATIFLPLAAASALAMGVTTIHRRLPPALAARVVAFTLLVIIAAAVPTLWIVSISFVGHVPFVGPGFQWCAKAFGVHDQMPAWIGLPASVLVVFGTVRAAGVLRSYRRLRHDRGALDVADDRRPFAYTLPGPGGHVVVSTGLVDLLDDTEFDVVLAHEAAHGRYRHDRYLLISRIASASMPLLRPLTSRLEFSLERWADEYAVGHHGNREFVAHTLGKVALSGTVPVGVLSFAGLGVVARVEALLKPAVDEARHSLMVATSVGILATGVLAGVQMHHLVSILTALCPG